MIETFINTNKNCLLIHLSQSHFSDDDGDRDVHGDAHDDDHGEGRGVGHDEDLDHQMEVDDEDHT